ncbi:hypothetical protein DRO38_06700, partial [Candidatus Bathyarchaeota archaeon]
MYSSRTWAISLSLSLLLLIPFKSWGFSPILAYDGYKTTPTTWPDKMVTFYIHSSGAQRLTQTELEIIFKKAAETWNSVFTSDVQIKIAGFTDILPSAISNEVDGINVIYFDKIGEIIPTGSGIIGVTYVFFDESGEIKDTDIIFNDKDYNFSMFQK